MDLWRGSFSMPEMLEECVPKAMQWLQTTTTTKKLQTEMAIEEYFRSFATKKSWFKNLYSKFKEKNEIVHWKYFKNRKYDFSKSPWLCRKLCANSLAYLSRPNVTHVVFHLRYLYCNYLFIIYIFLHKI